MAKDTNKKNSARRAMTQVEALNHLSFKYKNKFLCECETLNNNNRKKNLEDFANQLPQTLDTLKKIHRSYKKAVAEFERIAEHIGIWELLYSEREELKPRNAEELEDEIRDNLTDIITDKIEIYLDGEEMTDEERETRIDELTEEIRDEIDAYIDDDIEEGMTLAEAKHWWDIRGRDIIDEYIDSL